MRVSAKLTIGAAAACVALVLQTAQATPGLASPATEATGGLRPLTPAEAAALSVNADVPVIVLLKSQPAVVRPTTAAAKTRAAKIAKAQAPLRTELRRVHAKHVRSFGLVNAVAGTVSKGEEARLASDPAVAQVIPDSAIKGAPPATSSSATTGPASGSQVCPDPGKVMLEPEALDVTHTDSDSPTAKTARSLGYTGAGVKVAYIAEGIDINNPDFIRADGSHVFADYQDFTGDGPNAPTSGGEAFLDASAIAAQGRQVYDVSRFGAHPLSTPCDVRIEGMAPGASLYGFKVFGENAYSTTSAILQSIDWAVNHDHVDVINQSFGYNPFPDTTALDVVKQFDSAAVRAGVTVTTSSGDAGTNSTQGSPSTDPDVISVGASTTFRWYAQTDYGAYGQFATNGWLNDNVSSLSSSGFTQSGGGIDLLAPGDSSFALCTADPDLYQDCVDFNGNPADVERSGGTSESAPLTAGAAALVIQAYRQRHGGASPSPALVKQILVSTADDLTEPGDEQGAGLLDSYKAVQAAASVQDSHGSPGATGSTLLVSRNQLIGDGATDSRQQWRVKVTNTGAARQTVHLSGRDFTAAHQIATGSVTLSDTASPHFADWSGVENNYGSLTFDVAPHTDRLNAAIAYPGDPDASLNARVRVILIDPLGRYAAHSLAQGVGNYGQVDVRFPTAGTWRAIIFSRVSAVGGTVGTVKFSASTQQTARFGSVSPSSLTLQPGQTGAVVVTARTPAKAGDASGALVLDAGPGGQTSIPILLRSLLDVRHGSGRFSGVLTGGNGRQPDLGQTNFVQFTVPRGQQDLAASVDLSADLGDNVNIFLIDPHGVAQAVGTNQLATSYDPATRTGDLVPQLNTDAYVRNPAPGRWTLSINFAGAVVGDRLSVPFAGRVRLDSVRVDGSAVPSGASLAPGVPVTVPVKIHNTGTAPANYFIDARTVARTVLALKAMVPATVPLPIPGDAGSPAWLVPSQTSALAVSARATQPMMFDYGPESGDPDLVSGVTGTTAVGAVAGSPLPSGLWAADPSETGPTPAGGGPAGTVTFTTLALTRGFDAAVTSPAGDLWRSAVAPETSLGLVTVAPGQSVTIPVTITPTASSGTVVRGTLFVDQLVVGSTDTLNAINFADPAPTEPNANEIAAVPYRYRVR